jgi:hypothetical protein
MQPTQAAIRKDDQVLDIYYAVTPGHRANITQWLARAPVVNHDAHINGVNDFIAVEVNDGDDWRLPYIPTIKWAGAEE